MCDPATGEGSSACAVPELEAHPSAAGLHELVEDVEAQRVESKLRSPYGNLT